MNPTLDDNYNYSFNTIEWCENIIIKPDVDNKILLEKIEYKAPIYPFIRRRNTLDNINKLQFKNWLGDNKYELYNSYQDFLITYSNFYINFTIDDDELFNRYNLLLFTYKYNVLNYPYIVLDSYDNNNDSTYISKESIYEFRYSPLVYDDLYPIFKQYSGCGIFNNLSLTVITEFFYQFIDLDYLISNNDTVIEVLDNDDYEINYTPYN